MSYSDLSLMGSCSSNNNSISHVDHFGVNYDSALAAASYAHCFGSAPADGAPSLLQMLHPGSFVHDGLIGGTGPVDSASVEMLYGSAFAADLASNGYVVSNVFGQQAEMEMSKLGRKRKKGGSGKEVEEGGSNKNEKKRRERLSMKYDVLKELLPNSTKNDRATIIADSMDYINELLRTLNELKILVDEKRRRRDGIRKVDTGTDIDVAGDTESSCLNPLQNAKGSLLRSSWLQRRSRETSVDVRIVEDEVFIKLTQHRRLDCLLVVSKVLDELSLDLLHLSGGNMGDSHVFMINAKIHEGSSVYACAVAKKMIEAMEAKCPHYP